MRHGYLRLAILSERFSTPRTQGKGWNFPVQAGEELPFKTKLIVRLRQSNLLFHRTPTGLLNKFTAKTYSCLSFRNMRVPAETDEE